jgi:hypothetical protein
MSDEEVIHAVRLRYRICNYIFTLGAAWFLAGGILRMLPYRSVGLMIEVVGAGIFSEALAMTWAIYRCPICDRYLSRFRPRKDRCEHCGAKVR